MLHAGGSGDVLYAMRLHGTRSSWLFGALVPGKRLSTVPAASRPDLTVHSCEICQAEYKLANKQQTIQNALDAHTARHRPPPRSALELLISGDHHNNEFTRVLQALRTGQRGGMTDAEEEEFIRQAQTRRLLVFAVMVVLCIIFFHIVGTLMMGDSTRMRNEHINPSPHTAHNGTSFHGNSTGHGPYNGRHDQNSPMGRFFRMMLFFYVIRMLFSRPPPPDRRGLYL
eukprot:TRINITY_DN8526_c0_g1_i3.p1 TRINITY_DN8526_c0_g1~~TRINITY_DN8526_c0_g1_i3.p1  ORF type:complete len:227 (-),score=24.78 TRINITY_DN8526_c0_g1_i3:167-847(-)